MSKLVSTLSGVSIFIQQKPRSFRQALLEAISERRYDGCQVDVFEDKFYDGLVKSGGILFLAGDWSCGFYVDSRGEVGSLFKTLQCKVRAADLLNISIKHGGRFFNAYATTHLENLYLKSGFIPVARMRFDEDLAQDGWRQSSISTKPDVVFFIYSPNEKSYIGAGKYFDDFDDANSYAIKLSKNK